MWMKFIKIRKDERLSVCLFLLWQFIMHATVIIPYYSVFSRISRIIGKTSSIGSMCQVLTHSLTALLPIGQQPTMCIDTLYWLSSTIQSILLIRG